MLCIDRQYMYYNIKEMLNINDATPPAWLKEKIRLARKGDGGDKIRETNDLLSRLGLNTVCDSARCPNRNECFSHHTATFLILGDICTRACAFCAVKHGHPSYPDTGEPIRLVHAASELGLSHIVITSVTRDDLEDGGSGHYATVIQSLRDFCPNVKIEVLVPDFNGAEDAMAKVLSAEPDIFAHNIETVPRLYSNIRPGANYTRSLKLLSRAKRLFPDIITKSGIMLGLGENKKEIQSTLSDLIKADCDMLTIGQYLSPSLAHAPVQRYVPEDEFIYWQKEAMALGFKSVASGSLVRSSYKASLFFKEMQ